MNTLAIHNPLLVFAQPKPWLGKIKQNFPFLYYTAWGHFVITFFAIALIFIDSREITGINAWIKPTKFLISSFIYLLTIGWYLLFFPFKSISKKIISVALTLIISIENIIIIIQAYRGVRSHFNMATAFDATLWSIMGTAIGILTLIMFWFFFKSFSANLDFSWDQKWAFRLAWLSLLVAAFAGNLMAGQSGHSVGVADGGSGLPFLNWSTKGGDLRAAHFLGLHAIQIIPLFIYWTATRIASNTKRQWMNIGFSLVFLILVSTVFLLAKAGIPLINL